MTVGCPGEIRAAPVARARSLGHLGPTDRSRAKISSRRWKSKSAKANSPSKRRTKLPPCPGVGRGFAEVAAKREVMLGFSDPLWPKERQRRGQTNNA